MKCLLDMTMEDFECLHNSFNLDEWQIFDTPLNNNPEYRTNRVTNSRYSYIYDFLIDLASYKDIYRNKQQAYPNDIPADKNNFEHNYLNTEIVSWIDSLYFIHKTLRHLDKKYRNEINIISEYCLFEQTTNNYGLNFEDLIPNVLSYNNIQYRTDYIITYKNQIAIIEVTEIPSNKYFKQEELIKEKKEKNLKYKELLLNYLTKEQKEKIEIHGSTLHIHTHRPDINNNPENNNYNYNTEYTIEQQITMFKNFLIKKLFEPNENNTDTNLAYNILKTINNYVPPKINH